VFYFVFFILLTRFLLFFSYLYFFFLFLTTRDTGRGSPTQLLWIEPLSGERIPTFGSRNAEGAPEIAAAECHSKRWNDLKLVGYFDLRRENPRLRSCVAQPIVSFQAIHSAGMGAEFAIPQGLERG